MATTTLSCRMDTCCATATASNIGAKASARTCWASSTISAIRCRPTRSPGHLPPQLAEDRALDRVDISRQCDCLIGVARRDAKLAQSPVVVGDFEVGELQAI